ncbi:MAG: hypothetical protein ACI9JO_000685, partial [Psychrobacter okhotskensis]
KLKFFDLTIFNSGTFKRLTIGRVLNSTDSNLNGLKMVKSCQTSSNN